MRSHAKATTAGSTMRRANGRLLLIAAVAAALLLVPAAAAPGAVLTVTLGGGGTGSVTGGTPANPKAINCSNTPGNEQTACSFDFGFFETVTLSRQATAGSIFTGWSGNSEAGSCQSGSAGSCSYFSFFSPVNVTASFAPPPDPPIETTILKIEEPLSGTARLKGLTNPNSALAPLTECRFEYGETTAYGQSAPCEQDPVGPATSWVALSTSVSRLKPSTTYHFRLFTANSGGADHSADVTLTTGPAPGGCPNEAIRAQQGATYLPNCRAFELVTPVDKGPAGAMVEGLGSRQLGPRASEDGDSIIWPLQNGMPGTTAGGWLRMKATRAADGWLSEQVSAPSLIPPPEVEESFAQPSQLLYGSPDLGCALVQSFQPLTEDIPSPEAGVLNLFRWNGADGSYTLISNRFPLDPRAPSSSPVRYFQIEASDDCSRIYFESDYEFVEEGSGQYEWHDGVLQDAGVLPDGTVGKPLPANVNVPPRTVRGGEMNALGTASWNAVSADGSRLFFTAMPNEGTSDPNRPAVFMREVQGDGSADVTEISESKTAVPTNGARYEAASPDGSRVFFRANYGIAATTSAGPTTEKCGPLAAETVFDTFLPIEEKPCDLYAYDTETGALTDLSAHADHPEGAQIQGTVAVDEDGSHVYFAALGQLLPGQGSTYEENVANESVNVYLSAGGELTYVTTIEGGAAAPDLVNGLLMRHPLNWNAKTSADGGRLLFTSSANLTGYDGGGGQVAYVWSADTETLSCVSCRPDGLPTLVPPNGGSGENRLLAKASEGKRSLSEDGSRVLFISADPLAPGAVEGKGNIYQWEEGEVSFLAIGEHLGAAGIASELGRYLGAGADGASVFLATSERLAPQDRDFISDVYAVRVDGGFPFTEPPPACQVDEAIALGPNQIYCQGDSTPQPQAPGPASAGFSGPGNPPESKPRPRSCPKGKVRRRGKCVKRPKRAAERKRNRATHTNRGGAK